MNNGNQRDRSRGPVVGTSWLMACTLAVATLASACGWWAQLLEPPPPDAGPISDGGPIYDAASGADATALPDARTFDATGSDGIDCTETLGGKLGCSAASVACDTVKLCPASWDPSQTFETCSPGIAAIMKESCSNTVRWSFFRSSFDFVYCYYDRAGGPLLGIDEQITGQSHCGSWPGIAYGTLPVACHDDAGTFMSDTVCTAEGATIVPAGR